MLKINPDLFKKLYQPAKDSHKGQNGKLTIVGGSELFHGASLWALKTASRIVDMVFYATVPVNEKLTQKLKSEFYDFIAVPRDEINSYIGESDAVLIGPGMTRTKDTYQITEKLLQQFPNKKWVIDAGSLQMMKADWLKPLKQAIITPHKKEFTHLFKKQLKDNLKSQQMMIKSLAEEYSCVIVLKGPKDIVCDSDKCLVNTTGNMGMTKGGTGDVLAGLISGLVCKNDLLLAASAGIYINGLAGDVLYKRVGPYFNATDLGEEIPKIMAEILQDKR